MGLAGGHDVPKYVASTTLEEPLPWMNSTLLEGDAAARRMRHST
jgi:hypothetical protein